MKLRATLSIAVSAAVLAAPAQAAPRVAALTPFSASIITRLGVRPVVVGQTLGGTDQYISSLKNVPTLTLSHPLGPNMEQLASYDPSIVLSSKTWARGTPAMRKLGMKVYESDPSSVAAVGTETRNIGKLLGRTRAANDLANRIANDVAAAKRNIRSRPRVLVILGVGRTPYAMLANSWGGDVVRQAGGTLLTSGLTSPSGTAKISDEIVVKRNPDIIIAVPHGSPGNIPRLAAYYRNNPNWRNTSAVKNKRVYVATGNSLLQPYPGVASTIRDVRSKFLKN
jgi:iron complex transport system substrate-binding protein